MLTTTEKPTQAGQTSGLSVIAGSAPSLWKYHRVGNCSKWVRGQSWVTKYDDERFCVCGYRGMPLRAWMIESPKDARKAIDEMYFPNKVDMAKRDP